MTFLELCVAMATFVCMVLIVYHHALYPIILRFVVKRAAPSSLSLNNSDDFYPFVTVIVPAYNEEAVIARKILNLCELDYPRDRLKIVIACDGCQDQTVAQAKWARALPQCLNHDITILNFRRNRGKVAVLNETITAATGDIVTLSDASAMLAPDALRRAALYFRDASIGVVAAAYVLENPGSAGEATYWRYQSAVKLGESLLGAPLGVHGALYFFRRAAFAPLPADTINDDFILPMSIVAQGYRSVYAPEIVALETECASEALDHSRRRRIAAGNMQQLIRMRSLLHPRHGGVAFAFASGKALRALMPFFLIGAFFGSGFLANKDAFFAVVFLAQAVLYGLAAVRKLLPSAHPPKLVDTLHYIVSGHVAGLIGTLRYLVGMDRGTWRRAAG